MVPKLCRLDGSMRVMKDSGISTCGLAIDKDCTIPGCIRAEIEDSH